MAANFTVCTFNMGSSVDDYYQLCRYLEPELKFSKREEEEAFRAKYAAVEKITKSCFLKHSIDVYCLQEAGNGDRPLLKSLKKKGFHLIHLEGSDIFNGVIALSGKKFREVKNLSKEIQISPHFKKDVAVATAVEVETGKLVAFVSSHVPGFNFNLEDKQETVDGDLYCEEIMKILSKIDGCSWQVLGADMNANPEIWNARFDTFTKHGFKILRTNSPTNVNPKDSDHKQREIDFILVKEDSSWYSSIFQSGKKGLQATLKHPNLLGWDSEKNSSDHQPVIFKFTT